MHSGIAMMCTLIFREVTIFTMRQPVLRLRRLLESMKTQQLMHSADLSVVSDVRNSLNLASLKHVWCLSRTRQGTIRSSTRSLMMRKSARLRSFWTTVMQMEPISAGSGMWILKHLPARAHALPVFWYPESVQMIWRSAWNMQDLTLDGLKWSATMRTF